MHVTRWRGAIGLMERHAEGAWVAYTDYEKLLRDNEALRFAAELNRDTVQAQQRVYNEELERLQNELNKFRSAAFGRRRRRA